MYLAYLIEPDHKYLTIDSRTLIDNNYKLDSTSSSTSSSSYLVI